MRLNQLGSLVPIRLGSVQLQKPLPRFLFPRGLLVVETTAIVAAITVIGYKVIISHIPRGIALIATVKASIFNGCNCACAIFVGHPPYLANVEAEAGAGDLEIGADSVGIHGEVN